MSAPPWGWGRGASRLLAGVSGAALVLAFPPFGWQPLVFVAFVPLLLACQGASRGRGFSLGWLAGAVCYAAGFPWVLGAVAVTFSVPETLALPYVILFVAVHALQFALFGAVVAAASPPLRPISIAAWWVVIEWSFPRLFPWVLGAFLGGGALLGQPVDLVGPYGLSALIAFVNASIARAVADRREPMRVRLRSLAPAVGILIAAATWGARSLAILDASPSPPGLRVAVVQSGGGAVHDPKEATALNWSTYAALTRDDLGIRGSSEGPRPDLVVWPESVLRTPLDALGSDGAVVRALVAEVGAPLLLGAPSTSAGAVWNAAYLFGVEASQPLSFYRKSILLAFGEYLPGRRWLAALGLAGVKGDTAAGEGGDPLSLVSTSGRVLLAPSICFEAILPGFFNRAVAEGAEVLVNVTNDAWLGGGGEPDQHLLLTTLRAAETRRWLVRASGSGVSAIVDPAGRVTRSLPLGAAGVLIDDVGLGTGSTWYVRLGDWIVGAALAVLLLGALVRRRSGSWRPGRGRL
jgi:apolipoprotein N-acyltransferase